MNELMKKESQALANSVTLESCSVNSGCKSRVACGVVSGVSKGKGKANFQDSRDDDQDSDFLVEFYNGHPVIRTTAKKTISAAVDNMEAQIPQTILRRTQPLEDHMDVDVENQNRLKKTKNASQEKTKTVPFWEEMRKEAHVSTINDKLMDTVVPIKLKKLLSISPNLISYWFGVRRVPPLQMKEKDLKECNAGVIAGII